MAIMTKTKTAPSDAEGALLTVQEIATLDRCSVKTVRRSIETGLLQALRVGPGGRLLRVTQASHANYRKAQRL